MGWTALRIFLFRRRKAVTHRRRLWVVKSRRPAVSPPWAPSGQFETVASPNGNLLSGLSGPQLVSSDGSRYP
jgi:hypothetical protein